MMANAAKELTVAAIALVTMGCAPGEKETGDSRLTWKWGEVMSFATGAMENG